MLRNSVFASSLLIFILALLSPNGAVIADDAGGSKPQREQAVTEALGWLRQQQQSDGSFGSAGATCDVAWVVGLAGADPDGPAWTPVSTSLLDACESGVPVYLARRDVGRMGKVLRAVIAAGADPRHFGGLDLIAEIEAKYDPQTGLYDPHFFFRQDLAVLALLEAGRPIPDGFLAAALAQQRPDGGWAWAVEQNTGGDFLTEGDIDATARTLQVLSGLGLSLEHPAFADAVAFLDGRQHDDAGWGLEDGPSNANSTALAIEGLLAAGWDPESVKYTRQGIDAVQMLLSFQAESGEFIYRPGAEESRRMATLDAIPALLHTYPGDIIKPIELYLPVIIHQA